MSDRFEHSLPPENSIESRAGAHFRPLLELDSAGRQRFKERVKDNNGIVRCVIHPYYERYEYPERAEQARFVEYGLEKMVGHNSIRRTPIIIFEEFGNMQKTQYRLAQFLTETEAKRQANGEVYFVPTYEGAPEPKFAKPRFYDYLLGSSKPSSHRNWDTLTREFKAAKVEKILLGGAELLTPALRENPDFMSDDGHKFFGCVNACNVWLKKDFEVEISNLAFPANRKDTGPQLSE